MVGEYESWIFCLVLQIFLYLTVFECNTTSDWLNQVMLHSNSQSWRKKAKNVFENGR